MTLCSPLTLIWLHCRSLAFLLLFNWYEQTKKAIAVLSQVKEIENMTRSISTEGKCSFIQTREQPLMMAAEMKDATPPSETKWPMKLLLLEPYRAKK